MKNLTAFAMLVLVCVAGSQPGARAQTRDLHVQRIILDDGTPDGFTFTLQVPVSPLPSSSIFSMPFAPVGNPTAGFTGIGTVSGQTLRWNNVSGAWEASSIISNNGTNLVTITGGLNVSGLSAGVAHVDASHNFTTGPVLNSELNNSSITVTAGSGLSGGGSAPLGGSVSFSAPVMIASGATHAAGIAPDPGATAGTTKFLREDATWAVPPGAAGSFLALSGGTMSGAINMGGFNITSGGSIAGTGFSGGTGAFTGLSASTSETFSNLSTAGVVHNSGAGVLSTSAVNLASNGVGGDVTGTLPLANLPTSIPNANLANASITITAGAGLSGGGAVALGSSVSLSAPTMIASGASHAAGIVPDPGATAGTTKFLREDGTWAAPAGAGAAGSFTTLASSGNTTLGTGAGTSNTFGNNATNGGATQNEFGNRSGNGNSSVTNNIGNNTGGGAGSVSNTFGQDATNNIGSSTSTNTIAGLTTISSKLTLANHISTSSVIGSSSFTGVVSAASVAGSDIAGQVTMTTSASATAGTVTVSFGSSYTSAPIVVVSAANAAAGSLTFKFVSSTTSGFTINIANPAASVVSSAVFNYIVVN